MCACFQKRNGETYKVVNNANELKQWSIQLGFDGEITDEFKTKYESVIAVRKNIKIELMTAISAAIGFATIYYFTVTATKTNDYWGYIAIPCLIFMALSAFSIMAHTRVIYQWKKSDRNHTEEYNERRRNIQ